METKGATDFHPLFYRKLRASRSTVKNQSNIEEQDQ